MIGGPRVSVPNPFRADGDWLKCQLHAHSLCSDGELPPDSLADAYYHRGYDVLTISDHWVMTKVDGPDGLLVIPGAELGVDPVGGPMSPEFLAIGIDELPEEPNGDPANWYPFANSGFKTFATFDDGHAFVREQGGATILCHPSWSGLPQDAVFAARSLDAVEVWNASSHRENDRGDSSYVWDLASDVGITFAPCATDDSHYPSFDVDDAWTMVRAADRTRGAVVEAIRSGRTYASNGPVVHDVERDGDAIEASFSPARDVWLHSGWQDGLGLSAGARGRRDGAEIVHRDVRGLITHARFTPPEDVEAERRVSRWWRLVVEDEHGRRAWTNLI